jgi:hypothetical protein
LGNILDHEEVLWEWKISLGSNAEATITDLPARILTYAPRFQPKNLASEVSMLLPTTPGAQLVTNALLSSPHLFENAATGLLLSDPTINFERMVRHMKAAQTNWITNLPTIGLHDAEFKSYLNEVGVGLPKEFEILAKFKASGMKIIASLTDISEASALAKLNPNAVLVLPKASDYLDGWPSLEMRQRSEKAVRSALMQLGWNGLCLGYRAPSEVKGTPCVERPKKLES